MLTESEWQALDALRAGDLGLDDADARRVVAGDDLTCAFLAPAPIGGLPGHTLVVTRRHAETIFDLRPDEAAALGAAVAAAARAV